jgi:regulator of replication initiation timing
MKSLIGAWDERPLRLVAELTALRRRVAELEEQLAAVMAENAALRSERDEQERVDAVAPTA